MKRKSRLLLNFIPFLFTFCVFVSAQIMPVFASVDDEGLSGRTVNQDGYTSPSSPDIFGTIEAPAGVDKWNEADGSGDNDLGIIPFLAAALRLTTVAAGIWTMINFVLAGWIYITGEGDKSAGEKVSGKMINSAIGLVIIATSYTIVGLISLLIFGDPKFILEPTFQGIK